MPTASRYRDAHGSARHSAASVEARLLPEKPCGRKYGSHCPQRHSGGVVVAEVKSRAGRRVVGLPTPVIEALEAHRLQQAAERETVANL